MGNYGGRELVRRFEYNICCVICSYGSAGRVVVMVKGYGDLQDLAGIVMMLPLCLGHSGGCV